MNPVIFLLGPTATGKSHLALKLARAYGAGILNCDSLQVYKRLDIGTAKPPAEERALVPHYLFDFVKPGEVLTAGDYRKEAMKVFERELSRHPIVAVGGSGFYVQALEKGLFPVPKADPVVEQNIRVRLQEAGLAQLYKELHDKDSLYAEKINPNDAYRIVRALVVMETSGLKMSDVRAKFKPEPFPYKKIKLGLNLDATALKPRVEARVRAMLEAGFVKEVEALVRDGYKTWPPLKSVGYKECMEHLSGVIPANQLCGVIVEKTMQLAKKQRTWFKRDHEIHWLSARDAEVEALRCVRQFLDREPTKA